MIVSIVVPSSTSVYFVYMETFEFVGQAFLIEMHTTTLSRRRSNYLILACVGEVGFEAVGRC